MKTPRTDESPAMQRILGVLGHKPNMSVSDISEEAFVGVTTLACGGYMRALKARQLVYVSGWRKVNGRFSTPLYSLGCLADVPRPRVDETSRDAPGMHRILDVLERFGRLTYREIAELSGLSANTVKNSGFLSALLSQQRIHIGAWQRSHKGPMSPVYVFGPGVSAQKPKPLDSAEKCARHRERVRIVARGVGLSAQLNSLSESLQKRPLGGP